MKTKLFALAALILVSSCKAPQDVAKDGSYQITPVPFTEVKVTDNFWAKRIETNTKVTIPIAYGYCESTGRIQNFKIAGGILNGTIERPTNKRVSDPRKANEFQTDSPFDDSDVFKIIEGAAYAIAAEPNPELEAYTDSLISYIASAQEADGYLYTYRTIMGDDSHPWIGSKRWEFTHILSHELYNLGHMYEAGVAYYQATGKREFLDVCIKSADLVCNDIGWDKFETYPGHEEIEIGLVKLYNVTGDKKYLDQAKYFLDVRGKSKDIPLERAQGTYDQSHKPVVEQDEAVGHSVRALYLFAGMADVAALTGSEDYVKAMKKLWEDIVYTKLYITGGVGAAGGHEGFGAKYELPNMSAYCETCAAIANVFWNYRLFLGEGDGKYIDVLERSLYNNVLAGVSMAGDEFFYPNTLESLHGGSRSKWFGCACCPSNIARFIPAVPGYIYGVKGNDIYVNLYISDKTTIKAGENNVSLEQKSGMPWEGLTEIAVNPEKEGKFAIKVRIPGWANEQVVPDNKLYWFTDKSDKKAVVKVNGKEVKLKIEKGYVEIKRNWKEGDVITVELPMEVRRIHASENVEADRNKFAIQRGPIVYCSEGVDFGEQSMMDMVVPSDVKFTDTYQPELLGGIVSVNGTAFHSKRADDGSVVLAEEMPFKAVPYYSWCHRGRYPMQVWYAENVDAAKPKPAPTIASLSKIEASHMGGIEAIRDQLLPSGSNDRNIPFYHWWPRSNQTEYIIYNFDKPYTVSMSKVFWYDDNGGCRAPKAWRLFYKDSKSGQWVAAKNKTDYGVQLNIINQTQIEPVETTAMKMEIDLPEHSASGMHEWILE